MAVLIFLSFVAHCQELTWKTLADVKWEKRYNQEYGEYINYPKFGEQVKQLKEKQVVISGYLLPVEVDGNYIVISALPFKTANQLTAHAYYFLNNKTVKTASYFPIR